MDQLRAGKRARGAVPRSTGNRDSQTEVGDSSNPNTFQISKFIRVTKLQDYQEKFDTRKLMTQRSIDLRVADDIGFHFPGLLRFKGLEKFIELNNKCNKSLVKAFYCVFASVIRERFLFKLNNQTIRMSTTNWQSLFHLEPAGTNMKVTTLTYDGYNL